MAQVIKLSPTKLLQLRIQLVGMDPVVWRQVLVPALVTLPKLHQIIQAVMGWQDSHLHEFEINGVRYGQPNPEWDQGLDAVRSEAGVRLEECLADRKSFTYVYDFGDDWQHLIQVEEEVRADQPQSRPVCLAGEGACPPENVGGIPGYEHFLSVMSDPTTLEYEDFCSWLGVRAFDPGFFDLQQANLRL